MLMQKTWQTKTDKGAGDSHISQCTYPLGHMLLEGKGQQKHPHSLNCCSSKKRATIWPSNSTFWYISRKKTIIQKYTSTPLFTAVLFTIARIWKQPKCSSTEEWIKKMWHIYAMEYYSVIKRKEIMPFAATWMDPEMIILSEVIQMKTNIICHLYVKSRKMIQMILSTK